ncbi:MAG: hypothetical protein A4E64_00397 [Syntrophorhabdus sp. PtaU1.Bin058]|nr:MAG: hypothetical protein A4E64_00397 [Syntrophorhabdus sp. PtaU1.Bin058]
MAYVCYERLACSPAGAHELGIDGFFQLLKTHVLQGRYLNPLQPFRRQLFCIYCPGEIDLIERDNKIAVPDLPADLVILFGIDLGAVEDPDNKICLGYLLLHPRNTFLFDNIRGRPDPGSVDDL